MSRPGAPDGTDTLTNIELLTFANGTFAIADALNDAPVATDDSGLTTDEDTPLTVAPSALIGNDTDADSPLGDTLTLISVQDAVHGSVAIVAGGIVFTPEAGYDGPASFTYTVADVHGLQSTAMATRSHRSKV